MWRFRYMLTWVWLIVLGYVFYCTYDFYQRGETWGLLIPAFVASFYAFVIWKTPEEWLK